jgi:hypothetical protein
MSTPRIVAALMSQGADLCQGGRVFDSTASWSFFNSLGVFKMRVPSKKDETPVWAGAIEGDVT